MKFTLHRNEIAKLFDINKETLRYYENKGLITPYYDKNNGYRCYSIKEIYDLNTVLLLRKLNIPIKEIKKNMKEKNINDYTAVLKMSKVKIENKIKELKLLHKFIENEINALSNINKRLNKIVIKNIPKRNVLFIGEFDFNTGGVKIAQNSFKSKVFKENFRRLGFIHSIEKDTLYEEKMKTYVQIMDDYVTQDDKMITINEGKYLCYLTKGSAKENKSRLLYLLKWIDCNNYIALDKIYELDLPDFLLYSNEEIFVTEYQIPIKEKK